LRLGVRRMDRTRWSELFVLRIPSRTPSLTALLMLVAENMFFVGDGVLALVGENRFFVDGERSRDGPRKGKLALLLHFPRTRSSILQ
jgi:hypothetical protein